MAQHYIIYRFDTKEKEKEVEQLILLEKNWFKQSKKKDIKPVLPNGRGFML